MKNFLTVSIFDDSSFERETLIEKQHTEGWANVDDLKYFRLFPLIETNTSDGVITGNIDDIESVVDIDILVKDKRERFRANSKKANQRQRRYKKRILQKLKSKFKNNNLS